MRGCKPLHVRQITPWPDGCLLPMFYEPNWLLQKKPLCQTRQSDFTRIICRPAYHLQVLTEQCQSNSVALGVAHDAHIVASLVYRTGLAGITPLLRQIAWDAIAIVLLGKDS